MAARAAFALVVGGEVWSGADCALRCGGCAPGLVGSEQFAFGTLSVRAGWVIFHHAAHSVKKHESLYAESGIGEFNEEGEEHGSIRLHGAPVGGGERAWDLADCEVWISFAQGWM